MRFDPKRLVRDSVVLRGDVATASMDRLASAVVGVGPRATLEASFFSDEERRPVAEGTVSGQVTVYCQRCLEQMEQPLHGRFRVVFVTSEAEAERLPDGFDTVIVEGNTIETTTLVEDELILALPVVARHESLDECNVDRAYLGPESGGDAPAATDNESASPFAVLESLKSGKKD